jgi:hypothetical protein
VGILVREADFERELDELMRVFDTSFNVESSTERFRWLYRNNPDGPAIAWVVIDDTSGQVIGCTAVFPRRVRIAGSNQITVAWNCGDFAILKRYRTLGAAVKLRRAAKDAIDAGQVPFLYAHPNDRMLAVHMRAGHFVLGRMIRYACPLRLTTRSNIVNRLSGSMLRLWNRQRLRPSLDVELVAADNLPADFDSIDEASAGRLGTGLVRDRQYIDWRFGRNPLYSSEVLVARDRGGACGFLVFTIKDGIGLVKDWLANTEAARQTLFAALLHELAKRGAVSASVVALESHPDFPALRRMGFVLRPEQSSVVTYAAPSNPVRASLLDPRHWYMTVGDRDI